MKNNILKLTNEAIASGATKKKCCDTLGVAVRTIQRWTKGIREDGRINNLIKNSNTLTKKEIDEIVRVCCLKEYRNMSPNQIVPVLA